MTTSAVTDNPQAQRFELQTHGVMAFVDYQRRGGVLVLTHAEVPIALQGRGIGATLAQGTLELIRSRNEKMLPQCSFIAAYLRRHPEYQSLQALPGC